MNVALPSSVANASAKRRTSFVGRRAVGLVQVTGVLVGVLGLSKLHASIVATEPYDLSASARLSWALGLVGLYGLTAYVAGLPSGVRTKRGAVIAAIASGLAATLAFSLVQLALGVALLPRYVVFGSLLLVVPWLVLCSAAAAQLNHDVTDNASLSSATSTRHSRWPPTANAMSSGRCACRRRSLSSTPARQATPIP
jgi:hypothetical protein